MNYVRSKDAQQQWARTSWTQELHSDKNDNTITRVSLFYLVEFFQFQRL